MASHLEYQQQVWRISTAAFRLVVLSDSTRMRRRGAARPVPERVVRAQSQRVWRACDPQEFRYEFTGSEFGFDPYCGH